MNALRLLEYFFSAPDCAVLIQSFCCGHADREHCGQLRVFPLLSATPSLFSVAGRLLAEVCGDKSCCGRRNVVDSGLSWKQGTAADCDPKSNEIARAW